MKKIFCVGDVYKIVCRRKFFELKRPIDTKFDVGKYFLSRKSTNYIKFCVIKNFLSQIVNQD